MNKAGTQRIETQRLILRRFRLEDAEDMYHNWASDPEVTRYLTWPVHASVEVTKSLLADWVARYEDGGTFNWVMEDKETGKAIGNISVVKLNERTEAADMGYCMSRAYWGRGLMPEALTAVINYLFDVVGLNRIAACHDVNNPKSGRVMAKASMTFEGILHSAGRNNQGFCDVGRYVLLREDTEAPVQESAPAPVAVRLAREEDLDRVNELRRDVNDLHVAGVPDVFKPGFCDELRDFLYVIWKNPQQEIVVAELEGKVCGFAVLNHINKPENPFMFERDFLDIDEFGVDASCRRQGIASAMIRFIREFAREKGFRRIELNMWEFNRGALAFYEAAGFSTFRRYMEIKLPE
jgi:RimJ/RimL family protein N-acetyltransferase